MDTEEGTVKMTADELYKLWDGAHMKSVVHNIEKLKTNWNDKIAHNVQDALVKERGLAIDAFVDLKHHYGVYLPREKVVIIDLEFPQSSDHDEWLSYAKWAAMRIEQFRSHALRQNPEPHQPRKSTAREDFRKQRTIPEQAWLTEEDRLSKMSGKKHHKKPKKKGTRKYHKKSSEGASHNSRGPSRNRKANAKEQITVAPAVSRSRAAPGITPFSRTGSSQPARGGSSRLPAFPEFPGYGRN
jgi:hypothetical protein